VTKEDYYKPLLIFSSKDVPGERLYKIALNISPYLREIGVSNVSGF
jgi:hypothetical protein